MPTVSQAIFDPLIVAEWHRRRAQHRRASQWMWYVFWIVLIVACLPLFFHLVGYFPYGAVLAFCAAVAASTLKSRYMAILKCPHCDEAPVGRLAGPPLINVEHCPHCHYWLLHPSLEERFANGRGPSKLLQFLRTASNLELPLRFPFLHLAKALLSVASIAGFFSFVSFFVAVPVVDDMVNGVHVSPSWEAAVYNHGRHYQWLLLDRHRVLFGTITLVWVICMIVLGSVDRQLKRAETQDRARGRLLYWIANFLPEVAFFAAAWYLVFMPHR